MYFFRAFQTPPMAKRDKLLLNEGVSVILAFAVARSRVLEAAPWSWHGHLHISATVPMQHWSGHAQTAPRDTVLL